MPQLQLPIFPATVTPITSTLAFEKRHGRVTYFNGLAPVFAHAEDDLQTFRMITSQFCANGNCTQPEIVRAFGVPLSTVKRYCAVYQKKGPAGFYAPRVTRGPAVLTPAALERAQQLLDQDVPVAEVAQQLGIKQDTFKRAVRAKRVHDRKKASIPITTKSQRSAEDSQAEMGMGATDALGRVMASLGMMTERPVQFESVADVANGGVLLSLPALLANGLLKHTSKFFQLPRGYYGIASIFILLAFMALCRLKHPEALRYCAPGEWGKLLGLDRIPEVRTLRTKLKKLSDSGKAPLWSAQLCEDWMAANPDASGVLYVDGHVRVYHGNQTKLPRHYVTRERLCLRATTDYWVNAMDGQPFFLVNKAVDPGLIEVLREDVIPRLLRDVPAQPSEQQLNADPTLHRFTMVFDREGYSPDFMLESKKQRIACITYHKHQDADWPLEEFAEHSVSLGSDNEVAILKLAERGVCLRNGLWVREVRKLTATGHQTSVLATDYRSDLVPIAGQMFSRWTQENYFRYMREHFSLDRLADYQTQPLDETTRLVNPAWRKLDNEVRSKVGTLHRKLAQFGSMQLNSDIEPEQVERYERNRATLQQETECLRADVDRLKSARKATQHHIKAADLSDEDRFRSLSTHTKDFIDTIKMIAYRAETAMVHIVREHSSRNDDARSLLRQIYSTEADLLPDSSAGTLTVRLHHMANQSTDTTVRRLCEELNATMTQFPGTDLRLIYELVSTQNP